MNIQKFIEKNSGIPNACIFLSGSGTNAEKLLESLRSGKSSSWKASLLFTDVPEKSRAREIGRKFGLPVESLDIREFYRERGESRVSILTENGQRIREEWTNNIREIIKPYNVDFGILAGFVPLTNIICDFPCLNVHPGDLTVEENGIRILAGLHSIPIETAMLKGFKTLRSSVIVAQPYTGAGGEMDTGPILGISPSVEVDFGGKDLGHYRKIAGQRPEKRPPGGFKDELDDLAKINQDKLKVNGDWIVFPPAVDDFASGKFAKTPTGELLHLCGNEWTAIKTVIYDGNSATPVLL